MSLISNASAHTCPVGASGRHTEKVVKQCTHVMQNESYPALCRSRFFRRRAAWIGRGTPQGRPRRQRIVANIALWSAMRCGQGGACRERQRCDAGDAFEAALLALWMRRRHHSASPLKKAAAGHLLEWPWPRGVVRAAMEDDSQMARARLPQVGSRRGVCFAAYLSTSA